MERIYTANQPLLLPSIYMMNRYFHSEVLVLMEEAQFTKFGHQSRVEIMTPNGKQYLTVPLKDRSFKPINQVQLADGPRTVDTFKKTLQAAYGKYDAFKELRSSLFAALDYAADKGNLADFNYWLMIWLWEVLDMKTQIMKSRDVLPQRPEHPSEWVAELGKAVICNVYLGGGTAQTAYIREEDFDKRGIALRPQKYKLPSYLSVKKQPLGDGATDGWVSILDPLLVHGVAFAKELISQPAWEHVK